MVVKVGLYVMGAAGLEFFPCYNYLRKPPRAYITKRPDAAGWIIQKSLEASIATKCPVRSVAIKPLALLPDRAMDLALDARCYSGLLSFSQGCECIVRSVLYAS